MGLTRLTWVDTFSLGKGESMEPDIKRTTRDYTLAFSCRWLIR
mgnify:CR=1 FL=1|jgi:hypothetical protein